MRAKLILVEGLAGTGKSSTGQKLFRIINENGESVDLIHEFNSSHPVSRETISNISDWHNNVIRNWSVLVNRLKINKLIVIMDAAYMQYPIGELLEQGLDQGKIFDFVDQVTGTIKAINPALVYFRNKDIDKAITKIYEERESSWQSKVCNFLNDTPYGRQSNLSGFDLYLDFNHNLANICDTVYAKCHFDKLKIDFQLPDPDRNILRICEFLELPFNKPQIDLAPYPGQYHESGTGKRAVISTKNDMLEISGLFSIVKSLLPKQKDSFFIYGKPYELNFSRDGSGRINGFRLSGFRDQSKNTWWQLSSKTS